jgi:hypothetical protein
MIAEKLQKLSISFNDKFGFPLFNSMPNDELISIQENVEIKDSLRAKLADLCNIIDRIDQKKLNTYFVYLDSKGSKSCLIYALKKGFPTQHSQADEIESILDMIFLARDFFIHRRNRSKKELFDFFEISEETEPKEIWLKIYEKYEKVLDLIIEIFDNNKKMLKQKDIEDKSIEILKKGVLEKLKKSIIKSRAILAYMLSIPSYIQDDVLAKELGTDVISLRNELLCFYPCIVKISYNNDYSTNVSINENLKCELESFLRDCCNEN